MIKRIWTKLSAKSVKKSTPGRNHFSLLAVSLRVSGVCSRSMKKYFLTGRVSKFSLRTNRIYQPKRRREKGLRFFPSNNAIFFTFLIDLCLRLGRISGARESLYYFVVNQTYLHAARKSRKKWTKKPARRKN